MISMLSFLKDLDWSSYWYAYIILIVLGIYFAILLIKYLIGKIKQIITLTIMLMIGIVALEILALVGLIQFSVLELIFEVDLKEILNIK